MRLTLRVTAVVAVVGLCCAFASGCVPLASEARRAHTVTVNLTVCAVAEDVTSPTLMLAVNEPGRIRTRTLAYDDDGYTSRSLRYTSDAEASVRWWDLAWAGAGAIVAAVIGR